MLCLWRVKILKMQNVKDLLITSVRARELVKKENVVDHLRKRVDFIKLQTEKKQ